MIIFTGNNKGAMVQFTEQVGISLNEIGVGTTTFMPEGAIVFNENPTYEKFRLRRFMLFRPVSVDLICRRIKAYADDTIWFTDSYPISLLVLNRIVKHKDTIITIHDPSFHPTNNVSVFNRLSLYIRDKLVKTSLKSATCIQVLSEESRITFLNRYPEYKAKVLMMPLGAHIPTDIECKPDEVVDDTEYFLFFGRIDKYKGIQNMLEAYLKMDRKYKMIIAGSGNLTEKELKLATTSKDVLVINRYILDGEMKWLIHNSSAVVLPYIEASQSGVLPIAYSYNKPVIVSTVKGLSQHVVNNETGYICGSIEDYVSAMERVELKVDFDKFNQFIPEYYRTHYDWLENIGNFIRDFKELIR